MIMHDSAEGLISIQSRGRPSNEHKYQRLNCPQLLKDKVEELRRNLRLPQQSKMLLLLSCATDEMIRLVSMHPEVWFMDVTFGTNFQKRGLFVAAVRTPSGETFPFNLMIIPSEQRWVFDFIYKHAFTFLYGPITCSRNRLALFDEDTSEYLPFENCIQTRDEYKMSNVMLCTFHAVWGPYKKDVLSKFPRHSTSSGACLSDNMRLIGEFANSYISRPHDGLIRNSTSSTNHTFVS